MLTYQNHLLKANVAPKTFAKGSWKKILIFVNKLYLVVQFTLNTSTLINASLAKNLRISTLVFWTEKHRVLQFKMHHTFIDKCNWTNTEIRICNKQNIIFNIARTSDCLKVNIITNIETVNIVVEHTSNWSAGRLNASHKSNATPNATVSIITSSCIPSYAASAGDPTWPDKPRIPNWK